MRLPSAETLIRPFFTASGDRIRLLAKPYDTVAKSFYVSGWFGKRDWIAQNGPAVKKFVGVIYETARWANTHHDETAPWLATWLKLDTAAVKSTPRATFATTTDPKLMQPVLDIALRYNLIEKAVAAATLIQRID